MKLQTQGNWTAEEHRLFIDTAKAYGAGDKWGLFSSYIPNRVGYQCRYALQALSSLAFDCKNNYLAYAISEAIIYEIAPLQWKVHKIFSQPGFICLFFCSAYYRDVAITQGLIIDPRFKITRTGKAVYIG